MNVKRTYKLGVVETNSKPSRVTLDNVKKWYTDYSTHESAKDYTVYLVGSFAEKEFGNYDGNPYDLDVVLIGNIKDEVALKSLLEHAIRCGFDNDMMVDIWHNDKLMNLKKSEPIIQTRSYGTFIGTVEYNGIHRVNTIELWNGNGVELASGLFQYTFTDIIPKSWIKANKRLTDGKYKGLQIKIKDIL